MSAPVHHATTALILEALQALLAHGGALSTSDLATRCGAGRDSLRRVLREMAERGLVRCEETAEGDRWSVGPALPELGLAYLAYQQQRLAALRADCEQATRPYHLHLQGGRAEWRPLALDSNGDRHD